MARFHYRTTGTLTDSIPHHLIADAQEYLQEPDMTEYLDNDWMQESIVFIGWTLSGDGYNWRVDAYTTRELRDDELKELSAWVSGQNSDGHGEGFEQQDFAWRDESAEDEDCYQCSGTGRSDDDTDDCMVCEGDGVIYGEEDGHMCSFDWEKNPCTFERVS